MQEGLNKVRDNLKRKGASLDTGVDIFQKEEVRHIIVHMSKATFKGKKFLSLTDKEKADFDDLLYLSNVAHGNPHITYTV